MNKILTEHKSQSTESEISDIENKLSITFDSYYRKFLKENNGGFPQYDAYDITNLENDKDTFELSTFTSISGNKDSDLILDYTLRYQNEKRILPHYIVVGIDSCGSLILLNKNNHYIYFWDRDFEVSEGEEPTEENCYLIAHSFQEFFEKKLYEYIDEDD